MAEVSQCRQAIVAQDLKVEKRMWCTLAYVVQDLI